MIFPLLALCSVNAKSDTVDDLYEIYGIHLQYVDLSETIDNIENLKDKLSTLETINAQNEEYNCILDVYNSTNTDKIRECSNSILKLLNDNQTINAKAKEHIVDYSTSELDELYDEYLDNNSQIDVLLSEMNSIHNIDYQRKTFDIVRYTNKLSDLEDSLSEAKELADIGKVKDIPWILSEPYKVTSNMGYRIDPITKKTISYHSGTDFRAPVGTECYALFDGVVKDTGFSKSAGNFITVEVNEDIKYFVCHLSESLVKQGDVVKQGDIIALTGNTGYRTTGPHLHLALYFNGVSVDVTQIFEH